MKLFFWAGKETNLGRFGAVKRGDPLMLTDGEANYVAEDKNFRPAKKGEGWPEEVTSNLAREADPGRIASLEMGEMSHDQLLNKCADLKAKGYPIVFNVRSSKAQLVQTIKYAIRQKG